MKNILQTTKECYICHQQTGLHLHHIFFGSANRKISDRNGFTCYLCYNHHEGTNGVHGKYGHEVDLFLKQECQKKFEETGSRDQFMVLIGRNYL